MNGQISSPALPPNSTQKNRADARTPASYRYMSANEKNYSASRNSAPGPFF